MKVKLDTIIQGLESVNDEMSIFFDPDSNDTIYIDLYSNPPFDFDADTEDLPINAIPLPSQYEIDEYSMMDDFIQTINDEEIYEELSFAISGRGAFRNFKHIIHRYNIQNDWYTFRDNEYRAIAKEWCIQHNIEFEE